MARFFNTDILGVKGARVSGQVYLSAGDEIQIIAAGKGIDFHNNPSGGGGASYIYNKSDNTLLAVAGGGGGASYVNSFSYSDAPSTLGGSGLGGTGYHQYNNRLDSGGFGGGGGAGRMFDHYENDTNGGGGGGAGYTGGNAGSEYGWSGLGGTSYFHTSITNKDSEGGKNAGNGYVIMTFNGI